MDEITRKADELMGQNRWKEAEALFVYCKDAAARKGDKALELSLCSELLGFYRMRAIWEGFAAVLARTTELLEELDVSLPGRGTILVNAATGLVSFGETDKAMPLYQEAYGCFLRSLPPEDYRFAALFNNMASAFQRRGDYARAEEHIRMAMGVLEKHPHHPDMATSYVNLAALYAEQDREDPRIGECLDEAMKTLDDPEMLWDGYYAHTARKCAGGFNALGQPDRGTELEERAALLYEGT